MNISRRNFLIGGASFASLGAFGGNRFRRAAAGFKAGGRPRLRFGVLSDLDIGENWVMPLPAAESRPFAFAEHAKRLRAPEFPEGAKPSVSETVSKNRGGKSNGGKESIPSEKKPCFRVRGALAPRLAFRAIPRS